MPIMVMGRMPVRAVDDDGDVQVILTHPCGCCRSFVLLRPAQIEELIGSLRFAQAEATARRAGMSPASADMPARRM